MSSCPSPPNWGWRSEPGRAEPGPGAGYVTDQSAVRKSIAALSLTFDHLLVDGAPATRVLQRDKQMVERPYAWLTR